LGWIDEGQPHLVAGKRIRPTLTLLCAAACGADWKKALPFAGAVELIHNFSLVHDDIQDASPLRRGRATVWKLWGEAQAINAGDALFAYAHIAVQRARNLDLQSTTVIEAFNLLDVACLHLTTGQHFDMAFETNHQVAAEDYLAMIEGKTASLIATSTEMGALAAEVTPEIRACYHDFGRHLGLAFQMRDDILGIWGEPSVTGKSAATDILTRKKTLPILYGLSSDASLVPDYKPEAEGGANVETIVAKLEASGARHYTEEKEKFHADTALASLAEAKPTGDAGEALRELTMQLLGRAN
jgi:geranylgeranyl diphosphate synthase, type I